MHNLFALKRLLAIFVICFSVLYCYGQDEILKYIWCTKDGKVFPSGGEEPYGSFGGIEANFSVRGNYITCKYFRQRGTGFELEKTKYFKFAKIEGEQVFYLEETEMPMRDIIILSKDRRTLLRHHVLVKNGNVEWNFYESKPIIFSLKENDLPYWMINALDSSDDYDNDIFDRNKVYVLFKNNGRELFCRFYEKKYSYEGGDEITKEINFTLEKIDKDKKELWYLKNNSITTSFKDAVKLSFDRKKLEFGTVWFKNGEFERFEESSIHKYKHDSNNFHVVDESRPSWMN